MCAQPCLGSICGTNIDNDRLAFGPARSSLVYMDKVFSYNRAESCPILLPLTAGSAAFTINLEVTDPNCGCSCGDNCNLDCSSTFFVENAVVMTELLTATTDPTADQITVNGIAVDDITTENGQYVATTTSLIPRIQRCSCNENGLPTKTFFLASGIGPWTIRFRIILEGTVTTSGKECSFRAVFVNTAGTTTALPAASLSNFAIPKLSLPCTINGVAPTIRFQFGAATKLLNPTLAFVAPAGGGDCTPIPANLSLTATAVVSPTLTAEVVRKSLFCFSGCEAIQPCSGLEEALLDLADESDIRDPFAPDCACGTAPVIEPRAGSGCGNCGSCNNGCNGGCSSCANNGSCGCDCDNSAPTPAPSGGFGGVDSAIAGCIGTPGAIRGGGCYTCNSCTNL